MTKPSRSRPNIRSSVPLALAALLVAVAVHAANLKADVPKTTRVSVDDSGAEADGGSFTPSLSASGRFVAFDSDATNLVSGDGNDQTDVFVKDRKTGAITRVSVDSEGNEANGPSFEGRVSGKGRVVVFTSAASDLVSFDRNGETDIFVHDRKTGETMRVSVSAEGVEANGYSDLPAISANGRFVGFESGATNLVPDDDNDKQDVFVRDLKKGTLTRVSVDSAGVQGDENSNFPALSATGRFVAFYSGASNLVPVDANPGQDVFVHDLKTGATTLVSVDSDGLQADGGCASRSLSANGRFVAFESTATNLVAEDDNGVDDVFVHDRKTGATTRVSLSSGGLPGNGACIEPVISGNGRIVAFLSEADNLVPNGVDDSPDILVRDLKKGETTNASVDSDDVEADGFSNGPAVSKSGRFVAFRSDATNLVPDDLNRDADIFVRDRK